MISWLLQAKFSTLWVVWNFLRWLTWLEFLLNFVNLKFFINRSYKCLMPVIWCTKKLIFLKPHSAFLPNFLLFANHSNLVIKHCPNCRKRCFQTKYYFFGFEKMPSFYVKIQLNLPFWEYLPFCLVNQLVYYKTNSNQTSNSRFWVIVYFWKVTQKLVFLVL